MLAQRIDLEYWILSMWNYICTYQYLENGIYQIGIAYHFSKDIYPKEGRSCHGLK